MIDPIEYKENFWETVDFYHYKGWTDGLPVIPPTKEMIENFLNAGGVKEEQIIFEVPERKRSVNGAKIAINAILAGCLPIYMPVIISVLEAISDPQYNIHSSASSTGGAAPLIVINGPIRSEILINSGTNFYGPGARANASIGRAIRLILMNCLGAKPGLMDRSTQGNPGKYSLTFGENEELSPWEPLSIELGFKKEESTVTLLATEGPHHIQNHYGQSKGILDTACNTMCSLGSMSEGQSFFVFSPEHAKIISEEYKTKQAIKEYIFENSIIPESVLIESGKINNNGWADEKGNVRHALTPDDIFIIVAGGEAGGHSSWVPSWSRRRNGITVTKKILSSKSRLSQTS